ncbi:hypothetical protein LCGC14_0886690 [marine sediment metagenome]|uniref:DNA polymerase III beta sliding clamp central domain-containing protein n=1 Tax=marine sediment metagenome TaxID=412755 RepID=A0A0F9PL47_9ZZZZ
MTNLTIPAAIIRAAQQCQTKNDVRHFFNGILFAANGDIVSTDGCILFKCPNSFEVPEGFADTIININGAIPTGADELTFLIGNEVVKTDNKKALTFQVVDSTYPDYGRVIPAGQYECASNMIGFNPEYLARLAKIYPGNVVVLFHGASTDATLFKPTHGDPRTKGVPVPECLRDSVVVLSPSKPGDDMKGETFYSQKPEKDHWHKASS